MTMPSPNTAGSTLGEYGLRAARASDRSAIAETVGRAFFDDPVSRFLFPNETTRRRRFGGFASLAMNQFAGHGATYVTDPVQGAAIWQAPAPPKAGAWRQIRLGLQFMGIARTGYSRAVALGEAVAAHHFEEPHWYLAILGTAPEHQGRGIGGALIAPILERCDADRTPAYLESSKEQNIPFYNRFGFEVTGEIQIPDGPTMWPMLRRPR